MYLYPYKPDEYYSNHGVMMILSGQGVFLRCLSRLCLSTLLGPTPFSTHTISACHSKSFSWGIYLIAMVQHGTRKKENVKLVYYFLPKIPFTNYHMNSTCTISKLSENVSEKTDTRTSGDIYTYMLGIR